METPKKRRTLRNVALTVSGLEHSIDDSKLLPPRSSQHVIARDGLLGRLLEARYRRCFVVRGPAGSGKTTTLHSWRQALLPLGFDFAWLTLTAEDNELTRFLDYLLASVAQVDPAMVHEAVQLEGRGIDGEAVERTVFTLVRGIASHRRELVLVLDDLHTLTDRDIHEALQWLIDYAPANLHVVLASRGTVPLSLARLRSQDLVLELGPRDLQFSAEESAQFLKMQLGDIDGHDAQKMHEETDGWAAGLQLLSVGYRKGRQDVAPRADKDLERVKLCDIKAFENFFETEVLARLSPTDVELLQFMAVCNHFCAPLCAALTGHAEAERHAAELLVRLENDNLFLIPVEGDGREPWYRLHPLLRETLLRYFHALAPAEQQAVHRRAWEWLRDHEQPVDAVRHAVLGGEAAAAARLVEELTDPLYAQGDLRVLMDLVRQLPAEELRGSFLLRLLQARLQLASRDFAVCAETLARIETDLPKGNNETRYRLAAYRASLAMQRDDSDSAIDVLPQLQQLPEGAHGVLLGGGLNLLSWLHLQRGEYEQARQVQIDRPTLLVDGKPLLGTSSGILLGRCLVGLSLALEGQMIQAERCYREVLYEADRGGKTFAEAGYLAAAFLGEVLYETNELDAALQLLSNKVELIERIVMPDAVLRGFSVLAKSQWLAGNRFEAFAYMQQLEEFASKLGLDRPLAHSIGWQAYWNLKLGELDTAEALIKRLAAIEARHPYREKTSSGEIHIIAEQVRARQQVAQGDLPGATERLRKLFDVYEATQRHQGAVRTLMTLGVLESLQGNTGKARSLALDALRRGQRLGLVRSLLDPHPEGLALIGEVAASEQVDPLLRFYIERLQDAGEPQAKAPTNAEAPQERRALTLETLPLKGRELDIMRLLTMTLPNKKIARALGLSPETVKWHLSNIYGKLGVSSRDEAVERIRDLTSGNV
ncbi:HTH-type transcriptional regulator MalT [compost metagenome]